MEKRIEVEIVVRVNHASPYYSYDDKVTGEVKVEGYYPALVTVPFENLCAGLANAALNEFYLNQTKEETNGTD